MNITNQTGQIFAAIAAAQTAFKPCLKMKKNQYFNSYYADLPEIIDATREALTKNGLAVVQLVSVAGDIVSIETVIGHKSGEWLSSTISAPATSKKAGGTVNVQDIGSCITYMRRYAYAACVGVAAEEDDDGQAAARPHTPPAASPPTASPPTDPKPSKPKPPAKPAAEIFDKNNEAHQDRLISILDAKGGIDITKYEEIMDKMHGKPMGSASLDPILKEYKKA